MKPDLVALLANARNSKFQRWLLNLVLPIVIPFNRPHGFKVTPMPTGGIKVRIPHWRINRNHIRGTHACAIATGSEMCSGLSLLEKLNPKDYRLIMRSMHMEYHYQAKMHAYAVCKPSDEEIEQVFAGIAKEGKADFSSEVLVYDVANNHLATGTVTWQVKDWKKVKTK